MTTGKQNHVFAFYCSILLVMLEADIFAAWGIEIHLYEVFLHHCPRICSCYIFSFHLLSCGCIDVFTFVANLCMSIAFLS